MLRKFKGNVVPSRVDYSVLVKCNDSGLGTYGLFVDLGRQSNWLEK